MSGEAPMDERRKRAYLILLCAAMVHVKWDLAFAYGPLAWLNPFELRHQLRRLRTASFRAFAFHNLAMFLTVDLRGFDEEWFWSHVEDFKRDCPDAGQTEYRRLFERVLAGEEADGPTHCLRG